MYKTQLFKVALGSRHPGTAYMLAIQQRRSFSTAQDRPMLESSKTFAPSGVNMISTTSVSEPNPLAPPQYVSLTGLELFLAENPGLKPFLLAGPARDLTMTESAIAWSEICDRVFHLIQGQICAWQTGTLGTLRSRITQWRGVKSSLNSKQCVEIDLLVDDTCNTQGSQNNFATFDRPQYFGREFMPFFFVFGERVPEKSGHEIDLEDLRIKAEDEKVSSAVCHPF